MRTQQRFSRLFLAGCLATTLACGLQTVAKADSSEATRSVTVRYDDLNLSSQSGVTHLYSRISRAARSVCKDPGATTWPQVREQVQRCKAAAIDAAVKKVNNRILTAMHEKQSNRRLG
jgi:UrcA family protein